MHINYITNINLTVVFPHALHGNDFLQDKQQERAVQKN